MGNYETPLGSVNHVLAERILRASTMADQRALERELKMDGRAFVKLRAALFQRRYGFFKPT